MKFGQVCVLLCLIAASAKSQQVNFPKDSSGRTKMWEHFIGVRLGTNTTKMTGTQMDDELTSLNPSFHPYYESKSGYEFGLELKSELAGYLYFSYGFVYQTKGGSIKHSIFVYPFYLDLTSVSIPMVIGVQPLNRKNNKYINLAFEAGLNNGFINGENHSIHNNNIGDDIKFKPYVRSSIMGANLGVNINSRVQLYANYRFTQDLEAYYSKTRGGLSIGSYTWDIWMTNQSYYFGIIAKL